MERGGVEIRAVRPDQSFDLGMQSPDYSIQQLFRNGDIGQETAAGHAIRPEKIEKLVA